MIGVKKIIAISAFFYSSLCPVLADNWVCMKVEKVQEDLTASILERKDAKGKSCALLRVQILDNNVKFAGDIVGDVKRDGNEYLVYVPAVTQEFTVHPSKGASVTVSLPRMESKATYVVEMGEGETSLDDIQLNYNAMSVKELTNLANKNNRLAQRKLGDIYSVGSDEVPVDYAKCYQWFKKAALQGDAYSMCQVGKCYFNGFGVAKDLRQAMNWFRKGADGNDANAQFMLGSMYYNAVGVGQNFTEALKWFRKSADNGYILASTNIGICYYLGQGVEQDVEKALDYSKKAAMQGNSHSQCLLGMIYGAEDDSAHYNPQQCYFWTKMSADQGFSYAIYCLGVCYQNGIGTIKDLRKARECYQRAAEQGVDNAKNALDELK